MAPPDSAVSPTTPSAQETRFRKVACALLAAYLLLALSHHGEFWPFSRFPMFANAEKPWLRATLRVLAPNDDASTLAEVGERDLPGAPFPLAALQIDQNDLSEVIKKMGDSLDAAELDLLRRYFTNGQNQRLVLYAVRGRLRSDRSVRIRYRPLALVTGSTVAPLIAREDDAKVTSP